MMRNCDLADSPIASCPPETPGCDTLRDFLLEAAAEAASTVPVSQRAPMTAVITAVIDRGLRAAAEAGVGPAPASVSPVGFELLVQVLQLMSHDSDRHYALRAICYLRLLGHEGRSFQAIGDEFGITRQAVHIIFRKIQERHPHIHSRGDKSDAARQACRERRLGAKKAREPWPARFLWKKPLSILPPRT